MLICFSKPNISKITVSTEKLLVRAFLPASAKLKRMPAISANVIPNIQSPIWVLATERISVG